MCKHGKALGFLKCSMHIEHDKNVVSICPATEERAISLFYADRIVVTCLYHRHMICKIFIEGCVQLYEVLEKFARVFNL